MVTKKPTPNGLDSTTIGSPTTGGIPTPTVHPNAAIPVLIVFLLTAKRVEMVRMKDVVMDVSVVHFVVTSMRASIGTMAVTKMPIPVMNPGRL